MKRYFTTLMMIFITCIATKAMSYEQARREALYLTDKMAYELNLNADQYDYAYEINMDYLLSLNTRADLDGVCFRYRCADFRDILYDWQYRLFMAADYFLRPVLWRASGWYFPIYAHYHHTHFYYGHPRVYVSYYGGHGRCHFRAGYYANRRPHWDCGFRGREIISGHRGDHFNPGLSHGGNHRPGNNGFRPDNGGNRRPDNNGFRPDNGGNRRPDNNGFRPDNGDNRRPDNNGFRPDNGGNHRPGNDYRMVSRGSSDRSGSRTVLNARPVSSTSTRQTATAARGSRTSRDASHGEGRSGRR